MPLATTAGRLLYYSTAFENVKYIFCFAQNFFLHCPKFLQGLDGGGQGLGDGGEGEVGGALFGEAGDVEEADFGGSAGVVVEQGVEHVVADVGACGVAHSGGDVLGADGADHGGHVHGGEIGGGAVGDHKFALGLIPGIVGDSGVPDVHGDALGGHGLPAGGQADAQNGVGAEILCSVQHCLGGGTKHGGDLKFT